MGILVNSASHDWAYCERLPCVDGLLYGVTGPTGVLTPQGFTIDLVEDERYSVDIIATWSPDDKVSLLTY